MVARSRRDRPFSIVGNRMNDTSIRQTTRYHQAAHYDRRDRGVPRSKGGPVFRAAHDRFAERCSSKRKRWTRATRRGEEGPVACGGPVLKNVENNWVEWPRSSSLFEDRAAIKAFRVEEKAASRVLPVRRIRAEFLKFVSSSRQEKCLPSPVTKLPLLSVNSKILVCCCSFVSRIDGSNYMIRSKQDVEIIVRANFYHLIGKLLYKLPLEERMLVSRKNK